MQDVGLRAIDGLTRCDVNPEAEEADAENKGGKVTAGVPESEDDIEADDTIDDDDDDSTFIPEEEEGEDDVTDIIGDVGGDEEN